MHYYQVEHTPTHTHLDQREQWKKSESQEFSKFLYLFYVPWKESGSKEAPWKELYHLQSIKSEWGMSYGCIFINTLEVDGE